MSKKNSIFAENFAKMPKDIAFILYNTPEHSEKVQVVIREETLWMTQKAMAELFGVQVPAINKHLKNIFESGELQESTTVSKMEIVVNRGFRGEVMEETIKFSLPHGLHKEKWKKMIVVLFFMPLKNQSRIFMLINKEYWLIIL